MAPEDDPDRAAGPDRKSLPELRVFLSSPSDVAEERAIAQDIIEREFAKRAAIAGRVALRCYRYDDPDRLIPLVANLSPQEAVNRFMPLPRDCDIVIGILRARMGTPIPDLTKPDGSPYLSGTEWEIEDALRPDSRADVLLYHSQDLPEVERDPGRRAEQSRQLDLMDAFVARLRAPDAGRRRSLHRYDGAGAFEKMLRDHLDALIYDAVEKAASGGAALPSPLAFEGNPYPGLVPYGPKLAEVFCGRDAETASLVRRVVDAQQGRRLVAVMGASGSGKSSLAKAGLVPRLRALGWVDEEFRLRADPVLDIAERLGRRVGEGDPSALGALWRAEPALAGGAAEAIVRDAKAPGLLLVIDQFEEVLGLADQPREGLIRLIDALRANERVRIVLTLRADFVSDLSRDARLADWLTDGFVVAPPGPGALADIVNEPAARAGLAVDPALRDVLLARATRAAGALPLVCFALARLVDAARGAGETTVRLPSEAGDDPLAWALQDHIAATETALGAEGAASLPSLFRLLVRVGEDGRMTKQRAENSLLNEGERSAAVTLIGARLLTRFDDGALELAHETLLTAWPTLASWIHGRRGHLATRDEIERQRRRWAEGGRDDVRLLPHWLIAEGLRLDAEAPDLLTADQRAYLQRSRDDRDAFWERDSRRLAELSIAESERGDHVTAALLALEGLADQSVHPDRPLVSTCFSALILAEWKRREIAFFAPSCGQLSSFTFSSDFTQLVTGSPDGTVRLWDVATQHKLSEFSSSRFDVTSVAFSHDEAWVAAGAADGTVRLWNVATQVETNQFDGHQDYITSLVFSPDHMRLASGSRDGTVRLWGLNGTYRNLEIIGHRHWVLSVAFSFDGCSLASGSADDTARVWNAADGRMIAELKGHDSDVYGVAFVVGQDELVTGSSDRTVRLWNLPLQHEIARFETHEPRGGITSVAVSPDGTLVASGSRDRSVCVWSTATKAIDASFIGHQGNIIGVQFSADGRRVASGSDDGTLRLWCLPQIRESFRIGDSQAGIKCIAFSPNGEQIALGCEDETARVLELENGNDCIPPLRHKNKVTSIAFSPKDAKIATTSYDGEVCLWNRLNGEKLCTVDVGAGKFCLDFSLDGSHLATGDWAGTLYVYDAKSLDLVRKFEAHSGSVLSVAFSPDGRWLVTGSSEGDVRLWSLDQSLPDPRSAWHGGRVSGVAFSPDGTQIATGAADGKVRLWCTNGLEEIAELHVCDGEVTSVAYTRNQYSLAMGSTDGAVRLWDLRKKLETFRVKGGDGGAILSIAISPDGTKLVSGSSHGTARVWPVPGDPITEIEAIRARLPRRLTDDQRARFHLPPRRG